MTFSTCLKGHYENQICGLIAVLLLLSGLGLVAN